MQVRSSNDTHFFRKYVFTVDTLQPVFSANSSNGNSCPALKLSRKNVYALSTCNHFFSDINPPTRIQQFINSWLIRLVHNRHARTVHSLDSTYHISLLYYKVRLSSRDGICRKGAPQTIKAKIDTPCTYRCCQSIGRNANLKTEQG